MTELEQQIKQWLDTQQQYWQALKRGDNTDKPQDWYQFTQQHPIDFTSHIPAALEQALNTAQQQSAAFNAFAEQLLQRDTEKFDYAELIKSFQRYVDQQQFQTLLQQWPLPEPIKSVLSQMPQASEHYDWETLAQHIAELPLIAGNIEIKRNLQHSAQLLTQYQQALTSFSSIHQRLNETTSQQLLAKLQANPTAVNSLMELHQQWCEVYEAEYQQALLSEDFQLSFGQFTNTFLAVKQHCDKLRDLLYQQYGFVSQNELDQLIAKYSALQKANRQQQRRIEQLEQQLEQTLANNNPQQFRAELDALRQQVNTLLQAAP